jgi:HD-GYP domain-containing protein (c-di-GMP phosphodiesterase class II)
MHSEEKFSSFLAYIVIAVSNCTLYSLEHKALNEFSKKALEIIDDLFEKDSFSLTLLADSFIYNEIPVSDMKPHLYRFVKKLRAKRIERIVFKKGISLEEIQDFIKALATMEMAVPSSTHIAVGMLEVRFKSGDDLTSLMDESVAAVSEVYEGISKYRKLDIRGIEDVIGGFITAIKREAGVLQSLVPVKSHSMYTYVHETNVAVLTIFQARSLGLEGEALHDAGIAGLLHDVGKLFVPKEIIEKQGKLEEHEWSAIKLHPVYGAIYLSGLPDISKTTVIAAYEHHIKYNGSGYPEMKRRPGQQHFISQLVSIADVYDALRTKRDYREAFDVASTLELLKQGSGNEFNPVFLDNFLTACKKSGAI